MKLGALAALALLVVMTGPSEGRRMKACELMAELRKQIGNKWDILRINRAVCQAKALSGLDTALVSKCPGSVQGRAWMETQELGGQQEGEQITDHLLPEEDHHLEEEQEVDDDEDGEGGEVGVYGRMKPRPQKKTPKKCKTPKKKPTRPVRVCWPGTGYYGIFQLSDRIFCDSGRRPTRNLCKTRCSAFIDDDITDDIRCILKTGYWNCQYYRWRLHCKLPRC